MLAVARRSRRRIAASWRLRRSPAWSGSSTLSCTVTRSDVSRGGACSLLAGRLTRSPGSGSLTPPPAGRSSRRSSPVRSRRRRGRARCRASAGLRARRRSRSTRSLRTGRAPRRRRGWRAAPASASGRAASRSGGGWSRAVGGGTRHRLAPRHRALPGLLLRTDRRARRRAPRPERGLELEDFHAGIAGSVEVLARLPSREALEQLLGPWPNVAPNQHDARLAARAAAPLRASGARGLNGSRKRRSRLTSGPSGDVTYGASGAGHGVTAALPKTTFSHENTFGLDGSTRRRSHSCGISVEPCTTTRVRFAGWPGGVSTVN